MFALYKKEITGFFSSLTGYVVIIVFLLATGTFMWIIPGQTNLLDMGYANLDSFFVLAPWVFMFLIPAITMRLFTEELKTGTIELILTRPITDIAIVSAKFSAALTIAILAILPTFIYFITIYLLGAPAGNLDLGGIWGSYIGLFFLTATFISIGVFTSSLTDNQIIAFILGAVLVFIFFYAFDAIGMLFSNSKAEYYLQQLSINRHYKSISQGVVDTRDIIYFISLIAIFIIGTKFKLQSRKW